MERVESFLTRMVANCSFEGLCQVPFRAQGWAWDSLILCHHDLSDEDGCGRLKDGVSENQLVFPT